MLSLKACFSFHFRLDGCKDKKVILRFHIKERGLVKGGQEDISVVYANHNFPVYSYDGTNWKRTENKSLHDDPATEHVKIIVLEQTFLENRVWIAYQYPYSNNHLDNYVRKIQSSPFCEIEVAGRSTEGREIRQIAITDPDVPLKEKKVIWLIGLQHPAEYGAGWGLEGMMDFLLSNHRMVRETRERYVFKFIPIVNVDSVADGRGILHSSGRNLNREWERPDPVPEISSIKKRP
jgi:murein tripeptide amidase MpaA